MKDVVLQYSKYYLVGLMVLVLSLFLVACSEEAVDSEVEAQDKTEETATVEESTVTQQDVDDAKHEFEITDAYTIFSMGFSAQLGDSLSELSTLLSEPNLYDDDWILSMALALLTLDEVLASYRDYDGEIPSVFQKAHELTLLAVEEYQYIPDNLPSAIDNMDSEAIEKNSEHLLQGTEYITQATEEISNINK
jgi:hypothetical protein